MDSIDAALVELDVQNVSVLACTQYPLPREIQQQLRAINATASIQLVTELDVVLGELFADAAQSLIRSSGKEASEIRAIGCHGQTVLHLPEASQPRSLQIGDANIIARKTGITTVADFRRMDIAAGGQGAPLASAFHAWQFRDKNKARVILNIGGMANVTILPADTEQTVSGFDTGPGNVLMDAWTQRHLAQDYDTDGAWAVSGKRDEKLLRALLDDPYFNASPPKSTGKDDFNLQWLDQMLSEHGNTLSAVDVQATLLNLSACSIAEAINNYAKDTREMLVCGGGIHNALLMQRLNELLADTEIVSTEKYGIDPDALEAIVFAWLAKQRLDKEPGNLPGVTGASEPVILGAVYQPGGK